MLVGAPPGVVQGVMSSTCGGARLPGRCRAIRTGGLDCLSGDVEDVVALGDGEGDGVRRHPG